MSSTKDKRIERLDWGRILTDAEWELASARSRVRRLTATVRDVRRRIAKGERFPTANAHRYREDIDHGVITRGER